MVLQCSAYLTLKKRLNTEKVCHSLPTTCIYEEGASMRGWWHYILHLCVVPRDWMRSGICSGNATDFCSTAGISVLLHGSILCLQGFRKSMCPGQNTSSLWIAIKPTSWMCIHKFCCERCGHLPVHKGMPDLSAPGLFTPKIMPPSSKANLMSCSGKQRGLLLPCCACC